MMPLVQLMIVLSYTALSFAAHVSPPHAPLVNNATATGAIVPSTIVVDSDGTTISYTDSGAPTQSSYITIFAVNGLGFNANIFSQIQPVSVANGFRLVAVNRRGYGSSTPLTDSQVNTIVNGTGDARSAVWQSVGVELLTFIDTFAQNNELPAISADRSTGGVVIVSWSFACTVTLPAIAAINIVPADMRERLASLLRTLILEEPPVNGLGMALPPQTWLPQIDPLFPANVQTPTFAQWITAYFDHGDLSTRDTSVLEFILPSFLTMPSVWNNPALFDLGIASDAGGETDTEVVFALAPQLLSAYTSAIFNQTVRDALPNMKVSMLVGSRTAAFLIDTLWIVQDNATTLGEQFINFKLNNGTNHFIFWDFPQQTIDLYKELIT